MHDPGQYVNRSKVDRYTFNGNVSYDILKNLTVRFAASAEREDLRIAAYASIPYFFLS